MDFNYSQEQQMLADSLRRYLDSAYGFAERRRIARTASGFSRQHWRALADMGILGLGIPAEWGGFDEGAATQLVVQRELGRALLLEPVIPSAVMCTAILAAFASDVRRQEWLPGLAQGDAILALAWQETRSRYNPGRTETSFRPQGQGYVLNGHKCLVWHGPAASDLLVLARQDEGFGILLVPGDAPGVALTPYPTMDGAQAADVHFNAVSLPDAALLVAPPDGLAALAHGLDHGVAALCASVVGAMERLIEITTDYMRTRHQFGKPLAALQVVQHRVADMLVQKELALSMAYLAAQALAEPDPARRCRMLSGAKIAVARAARLVGQQAVQLHGGIGITDELEVGDYFKYLALFEHLLGDSDHHLRRYGAALAAEP